MSDQYDMWTTSYPEEWTRVLFYEGKLDKNYSWGKYSSLVKPHAADCDGHCDSCWTCLVFYVLDSGQSFCWERRWEQEVSKFVDRTPGFAELVAEHPRAMFQVIVDEMTESHVGHDEVSCIMAIKNKKYPQDTMSNFYLAMTVGNLLNLPQNHVWRDKFMATQDMEMFEKAFEDPLPVIVALLEGDDVLLETMLSYCVLNLTKPFRFGKRSS